MRLVENFDVCSCFECKCMAVCKKEKLKNTTLYLKWTQVYYSEKQKVMVDGFYIYLVIWVLILLINLEEKKNEFFYQVKLRTFKLN